MPNSFGSDKINNLDNGKVDRNTEENEILHQNKTEQDRHGSPCSQEGTRQSPPV